MRDEKADNQCKAMKREKEVDDTGKQVLSRF
jgi:hypothetical protein